MDSWPDKARLWLLEAGVMLRARVAGAYDPYIGMPRYPHVQPSPTTDGTPSVSAAPTQMLHRAGQDATVPPTRQMARDVTPNRASANTTPALVLLDSSGSEVRIRKDILPGAFGAMHAVEGSLLLAAHLLPQRSEADARAARWKTLDLKVLGEGAGKRLPIAWPCDLLANADGAYVGCLLRLPPGRTLHHIATDPGTSLAMRLDIGLQTCKALSAIHGFPDAELVLGDLCLENVLFVDRTRMVLFLNAAAMQVSLQLSTGTVGRHLCHGAHVKTPETSRAGNSILTPNSDAYQLAVLLFWLLVGPGKIGKEGMRNALRLDTHFGCEPPRLDRQGWKEMRHLLGASCCTLFKRAFSGTDIPAVGEWIAALSRARDMR